MKLCLTKLVFYYLLSVKRRCGRTHVDSYHLYSKSIASECDSPETEKKNKHIKHIKQVHETIITLLLSLIEQDPTKASFIEGHFGLTRKINPQARACMSLRDKGRALFNDNFIINGSEDDTLL